MEACTDGYNFGKMHGNVQTMSGEPLESSPSWRPNALEGPDNFTLYNGTVVHDTGITSSVL